MWGRKISLVMNLMQLLLTIASASVDASADESAQGDDSSAGTQALPVGKIIEAKVFRKDNPEISQTCMWCEGK